MKGGHAKPGILFVLPTGTFGGAERVTYNLLKGISSFEKILLTQEAMVPFFSSLGMRIHTFEASGCAGPDISLKNMIAYAKAISRVSRRERPRIIFGVMHFASLFSVMAKDLFFSGARVVASVHGSYSSHYESLHRSPTARERLLIRYLLKSAHHIVVPSSGIKADILAHFGVNGGKMKVIYNGFDLEWVRACGIEEVPFTKDCPWLVTASRLGPPKDFETLLTAFARIRETARAKLLIIGSGPYERKIRDWISSHRLDKEICLLGFQDNPFKYIARSDVFLFSSRSEGLPSAVIEAMAMGVPVICTDCPSGPREIIADGESGLLVPVGDSEGLASRCLSVLHDEALRSRLASGGRDRSEYFSIGRMVREYDEYLSHLVD